MWASVGANIPLAVWVTRQNRKFEIFIDAGIHTQLDFEAQRDVIGWDGVYGVGAATALNEKVALRFGYNHQSGHIGDEYLLKNNVGRSNYFRDEWYFGGSYAPIEHCRIYAQGFYNFGDYLAKQDDWRFQWGGEYLFDAPWEDASWFAAANFDHLQEKDWRVSATFQFGTEINRPNSSRRYRLAATYYDGYSLMTEFIDYREQFISFGLFVDY